MLLGRIAGSEEVQPALVCLLSVLLAKEATVSGTVPGTIRRRHSGDCFLVL